MYNCAINPYHFFDFDFNDLLFELDDDGLFVG